MLNKYFTLITFTLKIIQNIFQYHPKYAYKVRLTSISIVVILLSSTLPTAVTLIPEQLFNHVFAETVTGTDDDDNLEWTDEDDNFEGKGGNDKIDSKGGNDQNTGDKIEGDGEGGDDEIESGDGDDTNTGDNDIGIGDGGDDVIKSGKGNDINCGDNTDFFFVCETDATGGDDKINAGQGDDSLTGGGGADKCGTGEDTVIDFNEEDGDKATGNCETLN